ncbi:P-loop containing nucleoside triphosphate hydrolase protein [Tirmania nivea]|nr:P-loop containing nucleoside triphosphate hydrolase protein [Tirmania nivea]
MQRHEDPWEWDVDKVACELVRITDDQTVGEAIRLNRIDGGCLLTILTRENLKDEVGIIAFGTRGVIMRQVELWRRQSRQYVDYVEGQDKQRMKARLRDLVQDHRLQREFKRIIADTSRDEERSSDRLTVPVGRGEGRLENKRRSLSPLPDLESMELVGKRNKSPDLRPHVPIKEKELSPLSFLDGDDEIGPLGGNEGLMEVDEEPVSRAAESINIPPAVEIVNPPTVVKNVLGTPLPTNSIIAETPSTLADKDRLTPTHDRGTPVLSQSGLRRPSEHTRKKPAGGYLGPHALLVDDIFYGDRDLDAENSTDEDTFYIPPSDVPVGTKKYVEKQIRYFFMSSEQASTAKPGGLYRTALKPYRASLLRKHYKQSMTVFDVRGDKCKIYKAVVDDMDDLEWTATDKPIIKNDSQRATFAEYPESTARPHFNYNQEDNSEHYYDYLLKWMKISNDKALPEFGESGSEGEYDVQTWREIEEEEGEPLPSIPSKPLKVRLDKGKKPIRRERVRIEPEGSGEDLGGGDGLTPSRELPEREEGNTPVNSDGIMDLDRSSPRNIVGTEAEAENGLTLASGDVNRDVVTSRARKPPKELDFIDLTQMDDGSMDEAPHPPKRGRKNRLDSEDRRQRPERERKRTKRYPEKEDPVFTFSDDNDHGDGDEENTRHRRRRVVEIVEDIAAKASRANVHRLVKARAKRIQLEEAKWKSKGGSAPDLQGKVQINVGKYANEDPIFIHPQLAEVLKPHQIKGIRCLWGELVQSGRGMGALLAHTMGLGKTFQVIALLHTIAVAGANPEPRVHKQIPDHMRKSRSLVMCPAGLVDNWWDEFHNWLPMDKTTRLLDLTHIGNIHKIDASNSTNCRIHTIRSWYEEGGVLIMSYHMVRKFASEDDDPTLKSANFRQMLLEGPNIIVADEAHMMKSTKAVITKIAQQFKSTSRIALTGSPLSNNLIEYWTMIEWIDQKYLGPEKEFQINYVKPIYDGLWIDSTKEERRVSLKKLRVLKKILEPKVERADITAIQNFLPSKTEFLITIPLTDIQMQLYHILLQDIKDMDYKHFDAMHLLSLVNNHPYTVVMTLEKRNQKEVNPRDREEDIELGPSSVDAIMPTLPSAKAVMESVKNPKARTHSYRMSALRYILRFSIEAGDKVLVFTHSIPTLDLLEFYMNHWEISYLRLDGTTDVTKRQQTTKNFNADGSADVFIISTKAGGLGLNLFGANRVVIFDFRWTPMWEQQAVGRAYRIGQKKPVFVYRLVAGGTYEDRLRNMVDFKQQLQVRVIDQKDPRRSSSKLGTLLLKPPEQPEQEDLEEFMGKDVVLDKLLKKVDFIRDISYTQTFIPDDEDDLDEQEKADADAELQQLQALREGATAAATSVATSATVSSSAIQQYGVGTSTGGPVVSGTTVPDEARESCPIL